MQKYSGQVSYVGMRPDKFGNINYSFTLRGTEGFFQCGGSNPGVTKGEQITLEAEPLETGNFLVSVASVSRSVLEQPQRPPQVYSGGTKGNLKKALSNDGGKDQYWRDREERDVETQKIIQLQASRNAAISLASAIIQAGAVPGYNKAKENEKMDIITGLVDHLTDRFQTQVQDFRNGNNAEVSIQPEDSPNVEQSSTSSGERWQ